MQLTLDTTILGPVDLKASQILDFMHRHGQPYAWSVGVRHRLVGAILDRSKEFGFRTRVMTAQIMVETDNARFTGDVKLGQFNVGGIGATGGGVPGASFATIEAGVLANFAHMAAYIWGAVANWPAHLQKHAHATPRLHAVIAHQESGTVRTIRDLGNGVWAMDPDYRDKIVSRGNVIAPFSTGGSEMNSIHGVPFRVSHIPAGNRNRPGGNYQKLRIVVHETGNASPGANAEMHRRFTHGGGGVHNVSFQYTVDDREALELLPKYEPAYHGGDGAAGPCNRHGVGIEMCVNVDGNWAKTVEHTARLIVWLLNELELTPSAVIWQHWNCSGKNCPSRLRSGGWSNLISRVETLYRELAVPGPVTPPITLPRHPDLDAAYHDEHGFAGYTRWLISKVGKEEALLLAGYPITGEFNENGINVQYTERLRYEWHPGARPKRHDVLFGRCGVELLRIKREIDHRAGITSQVPVPTDGHRFAPGHGFAGYYEFLESRLGVAETLLLVGKPVTGEFRENGIVVQYTERMRLEWHPGARPKRNDVLFGRVGAELVEAKATVERSGG